MKISISLFKYRFSARISKIADNRQAGFYSLCEDGKHVLLLDYDAVEESMLMTDIRSLQQNFNLSTVYVFETSEGNYYALCLDKFTIAEIEKIMRWANIDPNFRNGYKYNNMNSFVMRMTEKNGQGIKFKYSMIRESGREKSLAHTRHLNTMFGLKIPTTKTDCSTKLNVCSYNTY